MAAGPVQQLRNTVVAMATAMVAVTAVGAAAQPATPPEPPLAATPQAECGPGSRPESGLQGQVPQADHDSGRAAEGYTCNAELVGSFRSQVTPNDTFGSIGGFKVHRYVDDAGNECAYYDSSLMFPTNVVDQEAGVVVLDMADPTDPVQTARLVSPGMQQMHETLVISEERGILAGITAIVATTQGILDIYDLTADCRTPTLLSSTPLPVLAHESGLTQDGNVFWAASTTTDYIFAVDISDVRVPQLIAVVDTPSHGINMSDDGTRTYLSSATADALIVLDTTAVAEQVAAGSPITGPLTAPDVTEVSRLTWTSVSIPQNSVPFTSGGHPYIMEVDEFGSCSAEGVGAARIIDMADEANPFVVSNLRLEVHQPEHYDAVCDDPGTDTPAIQGYAAHYCHLPTRVDPTIVACSMIVSGLRIFDITDPTSPVEVAYYNAPVQPRPAFDAFGNAFEASNWAMSAPAFVPERKEVWYTDAFQGFHAVRLTNGAWPDGLEDGAPPAPAPTPAPPPPAPTPLPVTGPQAAVVLGGLTALLLGGPRLRRRR